LKARPTEYNKEQWSVVIVNPRVDSTVSAHLLAQLGKIPPATIGHVLDREFMDPGLRPIGTRFSFVGPAVTVRCFAMDSAIVHCAVDCAQPGDVVIVDRLGDLRYACWGGGVALAAHVKGIVGAVVDGMLTDRVEIEDMGFPVFGRGLSPVTTRAPGLTGELNVPVRCGGVIVNPGDIILADDDGILVLAPERVATIVEEFMPRVLREPEMHRQMREGGVKISERSGAKARIEETLRRQAGQ
jgi:4-hydroxy-4-methyl-2-oxoglutarate aldolase